MKRRVLFWFFVKLGKVRLGPLKDERPNRKNTAFFGRLSAEYTRDHKLDLSNSRGSRSLTEAALTTFPVSPMK